MSNLYTLDKISKLFNIPKSTLRYWENEGLIDSHRNLENDYREYTLENLIKICDIKFYRSLNFPIKTLKNLPKISTKESKALLTNSKIKIENNICELKTTLNKIENLIENINIFSKLQENPYEYSSPPFNNLVYLHLTKTKNVLKYIENHNLLGFVADFKNSTIKNYGLISNEINSEDILLWNFENSSDNFITCLIKANGNSIDILYLEKHLEYIQSINKKPGIILAKYLLSDCLDDYYQVWIEIINN